MLAHILIWIKIYKKNNSNNIVNDVQYHRDINDSPLSANADHTTAILLKPILTSIEGLLMDYYSWQWDK